MSSGILPMKTQLTSGDRGNLALENLPNGDSACREDACLATGDRSFSPACSRLLTWVTFSPVAFLPVVWQCFCLAMEPQKRNSPRLSTCQDCGHGNGGIVCLKRRTDQYGDYTGQCSVSKEDQYEFTGLLGVEGTSGGLCSNLLLTAGSALRWDQNDQGFIHQKPENLQSMHNLPICLIVLTGECFFFYPGWNSPVSASPFHFSPFPPAQL